MDDLVVRFEKQVLTASELERLLYIEGRANTAQFIDIISEQSGIIEELEDEINDSNDKYEADDLDTAYDDGARQAIDKIKTHLMRCLTKIDTEFADGQDHKTYDKLLESVTELIEEISVDDVDVGYYYP